MGLTRNREIILIFLAAIAITASGTVTAYYLPQNAPVVTALSCLILLTLFLLFTKYRYDRLKHLSEYLKRVNSGDYSLEASDNAEGELSILKSEIYKVTVSLKEQNERLNKEKVQLSDSLSDISHQFKTPLTSMSVMTDLLMEGGLDEERRSQFTSQLHTQIERLKWLTEALLKLSKLDADAVTFNRQATPISELLKKSCAPVLIPMELKSQTLSVEQDEGNVYCDFNWTTEALTNILKNCMEHTPEGGNISVKAISYALFTEIKVRDSGQGIPKADLPYIFDRFYRGKNAGKDSVGIGLAMAKIILNAQDCVIIARNAPGGGAEFILRFPCAPE